MNNYKKYIKYKIKYQMPNAKKNIVGGNSLDELENMIKCIYNESRDMKDREGLEYVKNKMKNDVINYMKVQYKNEAQEYINIRDEYNNRINSIINTEYINLIDNIKKLKIKKKLI